jgi:hypothetical protein
VRMSEPIDRTVQINDAFEAGLAVYDDGTLAAGGELEPDHDYHAVAVRPTAQQGRIETHAGVRAVVWDLGIETPHGVLWVPDTMLDPPYSDI